MARVRTAFSWMMVSCLSGPVCGDVATSTVGPYSVEAAAAEIQRALQLDPENIEAAFALGILQEQKGDKREAQNAWDRYLETDPASRRARAVLNGLVIARDIRLAKANGRPYGWTRDGRYVLFAPENDTGAVHLVAPGGSGQERVVKVVEPTVFGGADLSPDGRFLAYVTARWEPQHVRKVYVQPVDNPAASVLLAESKPGNAPPSYPCWSGDGKGLLFNDVNDWKATGRLLVFDDAGHPQGTAHSLLPRLGPGLRCSNLIARSAGPPEESFREHVAFSPVERIPKRKLEHHANGRTAKSWTHSKSES